MLNDKTLPDLLASREDLFFSNYYNDENYYHFCIYGNFSHIVYCIVHSYTELKIWKSFDCKFSQIRQTKPTTISQMLEDPDLPENIKDFIIFNLDIFEKF